MKEIFERELLSLVSKMPFELNNNGFMRTACILDPRYDDLMEGVIRNFMMILNPLGWDLLVVSAQKYSERILKTFPNARFVAIHEDLITLRDGIPNISIDIYNNILTSTKFWELFNGEDICIFQKDCILFNDFEQWLKYDYIGANYYMEVNVTKRNGGINGGLSVRKKSAMLDCLTKLPREKLCDYLVRNNIPIPPTINNEDVYYTHACDILNLSMPPVGIRSKIFIEVEWNAMTCGYHGWTKSYHSEAHSKILLGESKFWRRRKLLNILLQENIDGILIDKICDYVGIFNVYNKLSELFYISSNEVNTNNDNFLINRLWKWLYCHNMDSICKLLYIYPEISMTKILEYK